MIPIEVFLVAILLVYMLGRRHGAKAFKNKYKDIWK